MSLGRVFRSWGAMYQKSSDLFGLFGMISDEVRGEDSEVLARPKHEIGNGPIVDKECYDRRDLGG